MHVHLYAVCIIIDRIYIVIYIVMIIMLYNSNSGLLRFNILHISCILIIYNIARK